MPFIWAFYHVPVQGNVHWRFQTMLHIYSQIQYGRQTGSIPVTQIFFDRVHLQLIEKILALFRALYHIPGLRNARWLLAQAVYGLIIQNGRQTGSIAVTIFFSIAFICSLMLKFWHWFEISAMSQSWKKLAEYFFPRFCFLAAILKQNGRRWWSHMKKKSKPWYNFPLSFGTIASQMPEL